jgi:hypothetical protein
MKKKHETELVFVSIKLIKKHFPNGVYTDTASNFWYGLKVSGSRDAAGNTEGPGPYF